VLLLPAALVTALVPAGHPALLLVSVPLAVALSVVASRAGAAVWKRRPRSRDLVFADLMLWGWLRRFRAERRLAEARKVLGPGTLAKGLSAERRVEALTQLGGLLEARDAYTHGHSRRVTRHAERIARAMHLPATEVAQVRTAAALHDVGKIHTPREILNKPERLTTEEFAVIKRHPSDGADMLAGIGDAEITAMVRHHHERLDGAGYPKGLAGEEIPLGARIIAVADTFDAMTSSRSYRRASSHKKALDVLSREAGSQLDARAVAAFLSYYSGSRSVAWSALAAAAPQRFFSWLGSATQGLGSGAATVAQTLPAIGAAALLAGTGAPAVSLPGSQAAQRQAVTRTDASAPTIAASAPVELESRDRRRSVRRDAAERRTPRVRSRTRTPGAPAPGSAQPAPGSTSPARPNGKPQAPGGGESSGSDPTPDPTPVPAVELPQVELPQLPEVELPEIDLPVELPPIELPPIELPPIELPELELPTLP
jgi:putative nucleotidyltransferase with HDIG domain